jgi:hypothetical protein
MSIDTKTPAHYNLNSIQPFDVMKACMTKEEYKGFLWGNSIKYILRWNKKNGIEDLEKAIHYIELLKELAKSTSDTSDTEKNTPIIAPYIPYNPYELLPLSINKISCKEKPNLKITFASTSKGNDQQIKQKNVQHQNSHIEDDTIKFYNNLLIERLQNSNATIQNHFKNF